jgi:hypothetical protein
LLNWIVALCLLAVFAAFLATALVRQARGEPRFRRVYLAASLVAALLVAAGVGADSIAARAGRDTVAVDLSSADVTSVSGGKAYTESMTNWGNVWSRNDHLVFVVEGTGAGGSVNVPVTRAGAYQVRIDYTAAPPYGAVSLSVNGQPPLGQVNLYSPRVRVVSAVHEGIELIEGQNDFTFTVTGKDRAASHHYFGVDKIVATRRQADSTRAQEASAAGPRARRCTRRCPG